MAGLARKIRFGSAGFSGESQGKRGGQSSIRHPERELSHSPWGTGEAPMCKLEALLSIKGKAASRTEADGRKPQSRGTGKHQESQESQEKQQPPPPKGPTRADKPSSGSIIPIYHKREQERERKKHKPKDISLATSQTGKPVSK